MAKDRKTADLLARREGRKTDSQAEGYFSQGVSRSTRSGSARIVSVPLGQILPDPFQPRPILPLFIKEPFFDGKISWREAAEQWIASSAEDRAASARIQTLMELGDTFDDHGQIKPVTGGWENVEGQNIFRLETGERRFWAKALSAVANNLEEKPHLECREIDGQTRSRERQVVENIHAESPTAVARAREIASLILSKLDLPAEKDPLLGAEVGEHEYFQSVLELKELIGKKYMPEGIWDEVEEVMGLSRPLMTRHLKILELSNQLQYKADLNRLSERVLREVMKLPSSKWETAIDKAIQDQLTAQEMSEYVDQKKKSGKPAKRTIKTPTEVAASRIKLFFKSARDESVRKKLGSVATELAAGMKEKDILDAADLLENLAQKLRQRTE